MEISEKSKGTDRELSLERCLTNFIRVAKTIVDPLYTVGKENNWRYGATTCKIYSWFEVAPLSDITRKANTLLPRKADSMETEEMGNYDYWKACAPEDDLTYTPCKEVEEEEKAQLEFQESRNSLLEKAEELHTVAFEIDYPDRSTLIALTKEVNLLLEKYSDS